MNFLKELKQSSTLEFIKEYFSVIIAIPYIAGGILQFFALTEISMDLLKFFSLSQLLIDGILILAKISTLYLAVRILSIFYRDFLFKSEVLSNIFFIIVSIITILVVSRFVYLKLFEPTNQYIFYLMNGFVIGLIIIFSGVFVYLKSFYFKVGAVMFFVVLLNTIQGVEPKINNFTNLSNKLRKEYKNVKLSYYNDQYLFYETNVGQEDNKIIIKKIDDIFEEIEIKK